MNIAGFSFNVLMEVLRIKIPRDCICYANILSPHQYRSILMRNKDYFILSYINHVHDNLKPSVHKLFVKNQIAS